MSAMRAEGGTNVWLSIENFFDLANLELTGVP